MKKLLSLILVVAMLLTMAACGNNTANNMPAKDDADNTVAEQQKPDDTQKPAEGETEQQSEIEKPAEDEKPAEGEKEEEKEPEAEIPAITASHSDVTLSYVGHTFRLIANDASDNVAVTYTSADESIATVTEDGTVTAVGMGTTQITMKVEQNGTVQDFTCTVRCKWAEESKPEAPTSPETEEKPAVQSVDLNACVDAILTSLGEGNAPALMDANADPSYVEAFFAGLNGYELKQSVLQMAMMSQVGFELAMVECANASDVEAVKGIFQTRIDNQVNGGAWYPAVTAAWENADLLVKGNVVALIVAGDWQDTAVAAFNGMF